MFLTLEEKRDPNKGWICPRCEAVHAPHIQGCNCAPGSDIYRTLFPTLCFNHQFDTMISLPSGESYRICSKCGAREFQPLSTSITTTSDSIPTR